MPKPVPPAPTASTQQRVRIFSVGDTLPSGNAADEAFLDAVVNNWNTIQAKGDPRIPKPPAYIIPAPSLTVGHEELSSIAQQYAERSDLPAVGWPTDVVREGPYLMARFERVPAGLAAWMNAGSYADISAEFHEDYHGHGPALRRVAILGAAIPRRPDLGDIPPLYFDEDAERDTNPLAFVASAKRAGSYALVFGDQFCVKFSEPTTKGKPTMNDAQTKLMAALQAAFPNLDMSQVDGAKLDAIIAACASGAHAATPPATNSDDMDEDDPNVMKNADDPDKKEDEPAKFAEKVKRYLAPLQREIAQLRGQLNGQNNQAASFIRKQERETIAAFCEINKDKIFPHELKPIDGTPGLVDRLLDLDNTTEVAKFSDNGNLVPLTKRALEMRAIANRPPVAKYGEKFKDALPDQGNDVDRLLAMTPNGRAVLAAKK